MTGSEFDDTVGVSGFSERSLYLRDGYEGLVRQLRQWQHFMDRHDAALLEGNEELALVIRLMLSSERDGEDYPSVCWLGGSSGSGPNKVKWSIAVLLPVSHSQQKRKGYLYTHPLTT